MNLKTYIVSFTTISYILPSLIGLFDEPTPSTQAPSADGSQLLSPAGVMYSTLEQLRKDVEDETLEGTFLEQLVQRLQRDSILCKLRLNYLNNHLQVNLFL